MPDLLRDEETETRTHSLCLFNVAGVTRSNRCENCPRRVGSRALYHQRRCPLDDVDQQTVFSPVAAGVEGAISSIDPIKLLTSSSKLQHGPETALAKILSDKTARKFCRRSRSDVVGTSSPNVDTTVCYSHVFVGVKCKDGEERESPSRINNLANDVTHNVTPQDQTEAMQHASSFELGVVSSSSDYGTEQTQQNKRPKLVQGSDINREVFGVRGMVDALPIFNPVQREGEGGLVMNSVSQVGTGNGPLEAADSLNNSPEINSLSTEGGGDGGIPSSKPLREFKDISSDVEEYFRNRPQTIFEDRPEEPDVQGCFLRRGSQAGLASLHMLLLPSADGTMSQEVHCPVDSIRIAGIGMIREGHGVAPCSDGVFYYHGFGQECVPMDVEETSELSVEQIEER